MEVQDNFNENQPVKHDDVDEHDSDIESRLYAKIYYSNTIIGDENNLIQPDHNDKLSIDNIQNQLNKNIFISNETKIDQSEKRLNNEENDNVNKAIHDSSTKPNKDNCTNNIPAEEIDLNNSCLNTDNTTDTTPKSKKRFSTCKISNNETINKKKKVTKNNIDSVTIQKNIHDKILPKHSSTFVKNNQEIEKNSLQDYSNKIINPYNKFVSDSYNGIQLLSPEFYDLFFKKKQKSKKQNLKDSKQNKKIKNTNADLQKNIVEKSSKNKLLQNNVRENVISHCNKAQVKVNNKVNQESEAIIVISSESSEDSIPDSSKYNMILATDKKLSTKESIFSNADFESSSSDSEESIFEVPIPPKPAPPLIELEDSDNESVNEDNNESEIDNNVSFMTNSSISYMNTSKGKINESSNCTNNSVINLCELNSESSESDNIILNCSEIQKGASSLGDIKKMSHQTSNIENYKKHINILNENITTDKANPIDTDIYTMENSHKQKDRSNRFVINEKFVDNHLMNLYNNQVNNKKSHTSRKNIPIEEYFFQPMSEKMKSFYNDSWGGENFDLNEIRSKMSTDPNKWAILDNDILKLNLFQRKRYFGMVCSRCHKDGHRQNQCPEPYKPLICHMCGIAGHHEIACPHKKCLTCGKKLTMYRKTCQHCERMLCARCKSRGHMEYSCPDLWRRYHQTINSSSPEIPRNLKSIMKPQREQFCCNCAKKGHDSINCKKLRWSQHFPIPSYVIDYYGPSYFLENNELASLDGTEENLRILNRTHGNSTNFDNSYNETINLDETCDEIFHINRENNEFQESQQILGNNRPMKINSKLIFQIKSKVKFGNFDKIKSYTLNLNVQNENELHEREDWKYLFKFLDILVFQFPANILFLQQNQNVSMLIKSTSKLCYQLKQILQQYLQRNRFERSYMNMNCERDLGKIANHLSNKFNEMNQSTENPLQLYEEIKKLRNELENSENQIANNLQDSVKINKLFLNQKKLIMSLYKEGCADNSLKKLKQLHKKIISSHNITQRQVKRNPEKVQQMESCSFKYLFQYLYYYNNIFVPYMPKNLPTMIGKYKIYIERCNSLKNNPLLFPQEKDSNINNDKLNDLSHSGAINAIKCQTMSTSATTSQIPSLLSTNTSVTSQTSTVLTNISIASQISPSISINTSVVSNFHSSSRLPYDSCNNVGQYDKKYVNCINSINNLNYKEKNVATKKRKKFKYFIQNTKKLLAKASKLNAPHLKARINILQNKMKNETCITKNDVKVLKCLVAKELQRQEKNRR